MRLIVEGQQPVSRERKRKSAAMRGYGRTWKRFRDQYLAEHPLCAHCGDPAILVDHIVPLANGGTHLDPDNSQSLCQACHNRKTAAENGRFALHGLTGVPEGLKPSAIPVTMVCGPPGAGKSTYANKHAGPNDLILDLDVLRAEVSGLPMYQAGIEWLAPAMIKRNRVLRSLAYERGWQRVWFIIGAPKAADRQRWCEALRIEQVVVLEVPLWICMRRIIHGHGRAIRPKDYRPIVSDWWRKYQQREGEIVIRE